MLLEIQNQSEILTFHQRILDQQCSTKRKCKDVIMIRVNHHGSINVSKRSTPHKVNLSASLNEMVSISHWQQ
jgi:hypothetical protein